MKVLVIGATGTIGRAVAEALRAEHEVVSAARGSGDVRVDIASPESIREMFRQVGRLDAVVSCTGSAAWVSETLQAMGRDPAGGLPAAIVARAPSPAPTTARSSTHAATPDARRSVEEGSREQRRSRAKFLRCSASNHHPSSGGERGAPDAL
jgi:uncharacterized protein YbjT (DUF2867 family)